VTMKNDVFWDVTPSSNLAKITNHAAPH
jgi:hypothetical protein